MNHKLLIGLAACYALLNSCSPSNISQKSFLTDSRSLAKNYNATELQVVETVNRKRRSSGKTNTSNHPGIATIARKHSEYLVKKYEKTGIKDPSHHGIKKRIGKISIKYSMDRIGENIAYLDKNHSNRANYMLQMWLNSPSHSKTLLDHWTHSGVGIAEANDGTLFVTQLFALQDTFK